MAAGPQADAAVAFTPRPTAVLIDVGFTLMFPDGASIAAHARRAGVAVDAGALDAVEPSMRAELGRFPWPSRPGSAAPPENGVAFFRLFLERAGAAASGEGLDRAAQRVWQGHLERNVWCRPGEGVREALGQLKAAGFKLATVSNSEGTIDRLMVDLGLRPLFDAICDSWVLGVAKPDPTIFQVALERLGTAPEDAVMVGDSPAADIAGARAAGVRAALIDPLGLHPTVAAPRFDGFAAFAAALLAPG